MKNITKMFIIVILVSGTLLAQDVSFNGKWKLLPPKDSETSAFRPSIIEFIATNDQISIIQQAGMRRRTPDTLTLKTDGTTKKVDVRGTFPMNFHMSLSLPPSAKKEVSAIWENNKLKMTEKYNALSSQGEISIVVSRLYEMSKDKNVITCIIKRDTRKGGPEIKQMYKRDGYNEAYVMQMGDNWEIENKLPEQACLISVQGIVNDEKPNLYFLYGKEWNFNYTEDLYKFLEDKRNFSFTKINSLDQALNIFKDKIKGYIVWDKNVRTSLIIAYTLAGLEKGIVITEDQIPLVQKYGFKPIDDFRGRFTGKSDFEIYSWAKEKYWDKCSRDFIIWLGGEHGNLLKPGVADFGMMKKVFFSDLSARATDTLEYNLTKKLLSEMNPLGLAMGWHSYKKDTEREWVSLTSSYGLSVDGLHTLPNFSFLHKVPQTPGFVYKNNHNIKPDKKYIPQKKVYISFVQTDGLGIGAWVKPGRGTIPYAWQVQMNYQWLAPPMLEYFYSQSTPNDYFIGGLSGSGYMYPRAFSKKWLPKELEKAGNLMNILDLHVFEIMDHTFDGERMGGNDLTKEISDEYFKAFPNVIGFLNGYAESHTFTVKGKQPLISYDYYLAVDRPEDDVVADLKELAEINLKRPYFMLVHVRESSDIARVKKIWDKLGSGFEIVPIDVFLKLAGENPTFKERFMERR